MKIVTAFVFFSVLLSICFAQQKLPLINATSERVDIRDGDVFKKGYWKITPKLKPDVYKTSAKSKKITFYTDLDSISFLVDSCGIYDFIILLNNKDTALTQIMYVPDNLEILKNAFLYDYNDTRKLNKFTYKPMEDTGLVAIRNTYNLDSVVGTGNEISQIINLLHWVHDNFPHNGSVETPQCKSMLDLMTKSKKEHIDLNCGILADVMKSCYLSMGFKSRRVVCLPKDSNDIDCHSINAVYSYTLNKWLWIDPTNDAYVMNEKGELLSISEVRERLINNLPLVVNQDANWNHKTSVIKEEYLYNYMAKNLNALLCYVKGEGESISNLLLPVEYTGVIPRIATSKPKCTNNPNDFCVKPE
jgi:hypothetical protein